MVTRRERLEAALGGKLESIEERTIPGSRPTKESKVVYLLVSDRRNYRDQLLKITNYSNPPCAKSGGASEVGCRITLASEESFYGLVFHGDIEGWANDIANGAHAAGSVTARIENDTLEISDGRSVFLKDCTVDFY